MDEKGRLWGSGKASLMFSPALKWCFVADGTLGRGAVARSMGCMLLYPGPEVSCLPLQKLCMVLRVPE